MLATSLCLAMVDADEQREAWEDVAPAEEEDMESAVDTEDEERLDKRHERLEREALEDERPLDEIIRIPDDEDEEVPGSLPELTDLFKKRIS